MNLIPCKQEISLEFEDNEVISLMLLMAEKADTKLSRKSSKNYTNCDSRSILLLSFQNLGKSS